MSRFPRGPGWVADRFYRDTSEFIDLNDLRRETGCTEPQLRRWMRKAGVQLRLKSVGAHRDKYEPFTDEEVRRILAARYLEVGQKTLE